MMNDVPEKFVEIAESAAEEWMRSKPDGFRGSHSLAYHVASHLYDYLFEQEGTDFDRNAALARFREIPMQHLENASFETFYMNGSLKQHESDQLMVRAFLEGSADWEERAVRAERRVKELEAELQAQAEDAAGASI